ncbi:hypothetical protein G3N56_02430 [Desulfovibrio sulfodismutans]|uniref:Lipoprotein n=1 Tax=Desulfolutivibrio sulfodismutans TaxID=63561 RepID=A0A7K3NK50_9BACT|nr:hypothetical protein [Desulfolutivibrio sulfodismutans]NDY55599.1 hypothetical protein [Desulfolutivibrio sulfodismutans]QLA11697.1 hypothetical protein GD606_05125 [Desulfolutivibrio sulfodismutans DSM 3696]
MPRQYSPLRRAALAALAVLCLAGAWGCQAGKTTAAGASGSVPAATVPAASAVSPAAAGPGGQDAALLARVKPFLDCAYAAFVSAQAGKKPYRPEAATDACAACSTLLEPFREYVFEKTGDKDYVAELVAVVEDHAVSVMEQASAAAR